MKNIKEQKFVFVQVRTNINGIAVTGRFNPNENINLQNALYQFLIFGKFEDYSNSIGINEFDLTTDSKFTITTNPTTGAKTYGRFIYEKAVNDPVRAAAGLHTNTTDGGLNEDYTGKEMFTYLKTKFLALTGNSRYANHFIVFCFAELPYDMVVFPGGGYSGTLGQVQDIGKKKCMFI
ncbi:hypothetical protein [Flavobacterium davisii]|uniref:hypothetical protein n=1 Tax=Flavobacterium davisii TaxID=2906077 RepID=UPI0035D0FBC7